jgi:hypothetical protein
MCIVETAKHGRSLMRLSGPRFDRRSRRRSAGLGERPLDGVAYLSVGHRFMMTRRLAGGEGSRTMQEGR